ncbi:DUF3558 domain-containing protein [Mycobacterium sp. MS1601]|uniref:DUF3558 domain-containing protein n=1 Tax=Mycobacterium sp. MS1601 TaxID=1936029 RepID=UPI00178CDEF6|nr:DUF3558 domain-containing protein [Mycobacterium sp. MS1601]
MAVAAGIAVTGCSHTVSGTAELAEPQAEDSGRNFGYLDNSCGRLADETVRDTLEADDVVRPYSGAVCQYVLLKGDTTTIDATFSWFDTGTLDRERAVAEERGAEITEKVVQRYPSILARTSVTGASCSATTSANPGVLSWWVQYRDTQDGDPCADAEKLLAATLSSEM